MPQITIEKAQITIEEAKEHLNTYIHLKNFDLLGIQGERLYFQLRNDFTNNNPLKIIYFDINTFNQQALMTLKTLNQNDLIYMTLGITRFAITFLPKSKQTSILMRIIKHLAVK